MIYILDAGKPLIIDFSMLQVPVNNIEFKQKFSTNEQCLQFLTELRNKYRPFLCLNCEGKKAYKAYIVRNHNFECSGCHRQESILSGTIFQKSRIPLKSWLEAIWRITEQPILRKAINAYQLQKKYHIRSYKTAWVWQNNIRRIMIHPELDRFSGTVVSDRREIIVPGIRKNDTQKESNVLITVVLEITGNKAKKIRIGIMNDRSRDTMHNFSRNCVIYGHSISDYHVGKPLESVIIDLNKWIKKFPPKSYSLRRLQPYFDEYAFRYNNQNERDRGRLFDKLLKNAVQTEPVTYRDIIKN